ncbi:unnamed protein product [Cladocopium goreaui]|uniref:CUB and sushi domain-containing protein 1 n=1 Tax=Cladocopium goreaui TaxID=2562237 RepID=A0A9P1CF06_9DINO|nr:unnamed protein product [Cladocopium goreaui]
MWPTQVVFLQIFVISQMQALVASRAVTEIRQIYGRYEFVMYGADVTHNYLTPNGFPRGLDKQYFDMSNFARLTDEEKDLACNIPFSQMQILVPILFIWTLTIVADLRRCGDLFVRLILSTPSITSMKDAVVEGEGECEIVVGLTKEVKALLALTCMIPRWIIDVYLLWLGCRWLCATPNFGDLLLNSVALEFIVLLKDTLFIGVVPDRNKRATQNTLIQPWQKKEPANYRVFLSAFLLVFVSFSWVFYYIYRFQDSLAGSGLSLLQDKALLQALPEHVERAFAHELAELALVRPFASNQEIQGEACFGSRANVPARACFGGACPGRLDENPVASIAAANVQNSFRARCFREFHIEAANLTAAEDIYDSRGYAVRKDWVNGPNKVFRFILQSFLEKSFVSDYEAFFFMEFDSTPLRPFWLDQFYAEVFQYPRAAIRGSRYRGDSWDNFLHHIPNSLLYHMNGNAIYFLRHPWLRFLAQKLEEEAASENGSIAFDVRMAQLTLEAPTRSDLQTAWTQNVPEGENPYQDDSLLVGNYANTLLNDSFEPPEFVRHGALANILENLDNSLVTLAVQAFHQANATLLVESLSESDFGEVVVVSSVDFAPPGTGPSLRVVPATLPEHMALCDLAAAVHTEYLLFTDTYHFIPGPTHVLVNGSRPVLPYIPASSMFCTAYPECTTSLDQAENFYGVKLNYHHNKYETLFQTLLAREFCQSWSLAAAALGSFDSCDYQHGPTADDYIAWLISMDKPFDYMPKNKERVGWRQWSMLWNAHPPDQRGCSIYTESDALKRKQSIKECSLYIQDGDACNADENCTFRAIFEAGKCMSTSEFHLLPATMDARTSTWPAGGAEFAAQRVEKILGKEDSEDV